MSENNKSSGDGLDCSKISELMFQCYLEEHKNCRTEIERTYVEKQKLYVVEFAAFGAVLLFIVRSIYFNNNNPEMINNMFLVTPLVFILASVVYIESHIRILANARYIHFDVKPKIEKVLLACPDDKLFYWESNLHEQRQINFHHRHSLMYCEYVLDFVCPVAILFFWCLWRCTDFFGEAYHHSFVLKEYIFLCVDLVLVGVLFIVKSGFARQYATICEPVQ